MGKNTPYGTLKLRINGKDYIADDGTFNWKTGNRRDDQGRTYMDSAEDVCDPDVQFVAVRKPFAEEVEFTTRLRPGNSPQTLLSDDGLVNASFDMQNSRLIVTGARLLGEPTFDLKTGALSGLMLKGGQVEHIQDS